MDLTPSQAELQARARGFVDDVLIPLEVAAERAGGALPEADVRRIRDEALARRLNGGMHAREHGGQGWSTLEWFLVEEQLGRSTNALSWHMPNAYNVLSHGSEEQIDRWLRPGLRGESQDAYAATSPEVTNHFSPSMRQPPSSGVAVVAIPDGSEPASASVTA
jgi:acyl-CoA dehydrogenase